MPPYPLEDVVDWRDMLVKTPSRRADLSRMPFNPTSSPRIVQSGSVAYDRWRLKRDRERDATAIRTVKGATDVFTVPDGIKYAFLVLNNPSKRRARAA